MSLIGTYGQEEFNLHGFSGPKQAHRRLKSWQFQVVGAFVRVRARHRNKQYVLPGTLSGDVLLHLQP